MLIHQQGVQQPYNGRDYFNTKSFIDQWIIRKKKYRYLKKIEHNLWIFFFLTFACRISSIAFFGMQDQSSGLMCMLPKAESAQWHSVMDTNPKIWMDRVGNILLDSQFLTFESLSEGLSAYAGKSNRAFLSIDSNVEMQNVLATLSILKKNDFNKIIFITD